MKIDNYLLKAFHIDGKRVWIERTIDGLTGGHGYTLSNGYGHVASIESSNDTSFKWFSWLLGKHVEGTITFQEIEKNLITH